MCNNKEYSKYCLLLPYNLVDRVSDMLHFNNGYSLRKEYLHDAFKIITHNAKNFFIGIGGEGFRNEYKYYQTKDYTSTEVHNSYIQIFLESGLLGFLSIISIIIYHLF